MSPAVSSAKVGKGLEPSQAAGRAVPGVAALSISHNVDENFPAGELSYIREKVGELKLLSTSEDARWRPGEQDEIASHVILLRTSPRDCRPWILAMEVGRFSLSSLTLRTSTCSGSSECM